MPIKAEARPAASLAEGPAFLTGTEVTYRSRASRPGSHLGAQHLYTCGGDRALSHVVQRVLSSDGGEALASRDFRAPGTTTSFTFLLQVSTRPKV